jgi:hypothetical protein
VTTGRATISAPTNCIDANAVISKKTAAAMMTTLAMAFKQVETSSLVVEALANCSAFARARPS